MIKRHTLVGNKLKNNNNNAHAVSRVF